MNASSFIIYKRVQDTLLHEIAKALFLQEATEETEKEDKVSVPSVSLC